MAGVVQAPSMFAQMDPSIIADQLAAQRQAQLAQSLQEQSLQPIQYDPHGALSWTQGLAKMLQGYVAGQAGKASDQRAADLQTKQSQMMRDLIYGPQGNAQGAMAPQAQPLTGDQAMQTATAQTGQPGPTQLAAALQSQAPPQAQVGPTQSSVGQAGGGPLAMPGVSPSQSMLMMQMAGPQKYAEALMSANAPTPEMRNAINAGMKPGSPEWQQLFGNIANKAGQNLINVRPGGTVFDANQNRPTFTAPEQNGAQITYDAQGKPSMGMVPNAMNVQGGINWQNQAIGKALTPQTGVNQVTGAPAFGNQLQASGNSLMNNPFMPQGNQQPMQGNQTPMQGGQGQPATGRFGGYDAPGANNFAPGNAPGVDTIAKGNADRANNLVTMASESPMRVNVLDNIAQLSQQGVATGPGEDWKNTIKGYAANVPGLGDLMAGAKDDVARFQEINKFLKQNALRSWQAAGGTGTDAQLATFESANPNDHMFPQAVQKMAQFAKAGEVAMQSKAAAQQQFMAQNGNNPLALNKFEDSWRQNFDPKIYQMKVMSPPELQQFTASMSPTERASLMQKYQTAKMNGWIS